MVCEWALSIFGGVSASLAGVYIAYSVLSGLRTYFFSSKPNLKKYGQWAIITGCTDGIGREYALQISKLGSNVVLISRNADKLKNLSEEIGESSYKVKTKVVVIDFTQESSIYDTIKNEIEGLEIGTLVNNVAMSHEHPQYVTDIESKKVITNIIRCNADSVALMTHLILPQMVERKKGVIINVASASALHPTPLLTVYGATKAFVDSFSRAVQTEVKSTGVIVQSVLPFFVSTKMSRVGVSFGIPGPKEYVQSALRTIETQSRTYGYLLHAIQGWFIEKLPSSFYATLAFRALQKIRNKAIRKRMEASKTK